MALRILAVLGSWLIRFDGSFLNGAKRVSTLIPKDPAYQTRIQASFDKQGLMGTLGAAILDMGPGAVDIALSPSPFISQQHGFVHAGAVAAIADSAAGYSAVSLMPSEAALGIGSTPIGYAKRDGAFRARVLSLALSDGRCTLDA